MRIVKEARAVSLVSYLEGVGIEGRVTGASWICRSPLREEKTASFAVSLKKNLWFDFGAGEGGDLIDLVMRMHGLKFGDAVKQITARNYPAYTPPTPKFKKPPSLPADRGQAEKGRRTVEAYFSAISIPYNPALRAFPLSVGRGNYIAIPVPTPTARTGLECRGFTVKKGVTPTGGRITIGQKRPWLLKRDPERYLICESITDALAGEIIIGDPDISLVGLNGVANWKMLPDYIPQGSTCWLALDNDGPENGRIGQRTQQLIEEDMVRRKCKVAHVTNHIVAGVKDLHRLLLREAGGRIK